MERDTVIILIVIYIIIDDKIEEKGEAYDVRRAASLRTPPTKIILGKSPSEVVGTTEVREDGI